MAHPIKFSPLPLSLPNSRMSIDFSTFTTSQPPVSDQQSQTDKLQLPRQHTIPRRPVLHSTPLQRTSEEPPPIHKSPAREHQKRRWAIFPSTPEEAHPRSNPHVSQLYRAVSNASIASSASNYSTAASSTSSYAQSASTALTAHSSQSSFEFSLKRGDSEKRRTTLASLPSHILEHILSYALCLPLNVSIGPPASDKKHMQYRYHRAGVDYIDVQLIRKHPVFLVSRHIRDAALHALHDRCTFIIDLHSIYHAKGSSTIHDNFKRHKRFWLDEQPPQMVRDTLRKLSRINIRLPAASCDESVYRGTGENDEVQGLGGQAGGNRRIRSLKKEKKDAAKIERYLEVILSLIWADTNAEDQSRGRSLGVERNGSLRKRSLSRLRSKSRERLFRNQKSPRPTSQGRTTPSMHEDNEKRQPLKRMEVVLVKRNSHVVVLPETLQYVKLLRTSRVDGLTKYFLEFEEQKVMFALKYGKRWRGVQPDGVGLLSDLQSLSVASKPVKTVLSSPERQSTRNTDTAELPPLDNKFPKTPVALERSKPSSDRPPSPSNTALLRIPLNWGKKKPKRRDSFQLLDDSLDEMGAAREPPSIDELKKIAEDVRNGLY